MNQLEEQASKYRARIAELMAITTGDTVARGRVIFNEDAAPECRAVTDRLVRTGAATWVQDPEMEDVVGLVATGTRDAYVVVYLNTEDYTLSDWETSTALDALIDTTTEERA